MHMLANCKRPIIPLSEDDKAKVMVAIAELKEKLVKISSNKKELTELATKLLAL